MSEPVNWDAIGAGGEILGAFAVVATLVYLATQIKSMKASATAESLSRVQEDTNFLIGQMMLNAELMVKANAGHELSDVEDFKVRYLYQAFFTESFTNYARQLALGGNPLSEDGLLKFKNSSIEMTHNMKLKPVAIAPSDVPLQALFANGFATLSQIAPSVSRRITWCYVSWCPK